MGLAKRLMAGLAAAAVATAGFPGPATAGPILDAVKARGSLVCGTGTGTAGLHDAGQARESGKASRSTFAALSPPRSSATRTR